ncbi:MAG: type II secretion system protein [Verrucomicrobium sp.]|nr:prepilin-type N-terminal cleavage/methylation domain-containing protein [Verrucomicrobium sp.]
MPCPHPYLLSPSGGCPPSRGRQQGFTLVEMLMVVFVVAVIGALVIPMVDESGVRAEHTITRATLQTVREALVGSPSAPGFVADVKHIPGLQLAGTRLHDLLAPTRPDRVPQALPAFDPRARRGWRGPYLSQTTGTMNTNRRHGSFFPSPTDVRFFGDGTFGDRGFFIQEIIYGRPGDDTLPTDDPLAFGDLTIADGWGNPIVIQCPVMDEEDQPLSPARQWHFARLVSAGLDGVLSTPSRRFAGLRLDGTAPGRGDDLVLFINRMDLPTDPTSDHDEPEEP